MFWYHNVHTILKRLFQVYLKELQTNLLVTDEFVTGQLKVIADILLSHVFLQKGQFIRFEIV